MAHTEAEGAPTGVETSLWTELPGARRDDRDVVDMNVDEGRASRRTVNSCDRPEQLYRHEWQVGDMVIWDNRGVLHRACRYDPTSPRDMHRTTLYGDEPVE